MKEILEKLERLHTQMVLDIQHNKREEEAYDAAKNSRMAGYCTGSVNQLLRDSREISDLIRTAQKKLGTAMPAAIKIPKDDTEIKS